MAESSGNAEAAPPGIREACELVMVEEEKIRADNGNRSFGGNRWPRQETLALLKIRSDMDSDFRDSTLKGPLWEEVSRKLAELGYHRSAKKCKEKFENVYKYHRRTKDGRTGKADGKTYRFFDQLEALENLHSLSVSPPKINPTNAPQVDHKQSMNPSSNNLQSSFHSFLSTSTSSSTASDDNSVQGSSKKKSKWKAFFRRLTKEVIEKQEQLQNKFLQSIERCELERLAREEDWRIQELAQINREHEILVQERSMAAAKDAALIAFLQKVTGQKPSVLQLRPQENPEPPPPLQQTAPPTQTSNNNDNVVSSSSSRWPKDEVEALIKIRINLEIKYHENGPKAPLWEEISAKMRKLGFNRSAKRCKEKWENINKYFKKVKESNKRRPDDSKTCPYFHQLDAIYKEKNSRTENSALAFSGYGDKLDSSVAPLMVRPEQQWPPPQQEISQAATMEETEKEENDDEEDDEEEYKGYDFELPLHSETTDQVNH